MDFYFEGQISYYHEDFFISLFMYHMSDFLLDPPLSAPLNYGDETCTGILHNHMKKVHIWRGEIGIRDSEIHLFSFRDPDISSFFF